MRLCANIFNLLLAAINMLFGVVGSSMATQQEQALSDMGEVALPHITYLAFALPSCAYVVSLGLMTTTIVGWRFRWRTETLVLASYFFVAIDLIGLAISTVGYAAPRWTLS